jgi:hypothetical protein
LLLRKVVALFVKVAFSSVESPVTVPTTAHTAVPLTAPARAKRGAQTTTHGPQISPPVIAPPITPVFPPVAISSPTPLSVALKSKILSVYDFVTKATESPRCITLSFDVLLQALSVAKIKQVNKHLANEFEINIRILFFILDD